MEDSIPPFPVQALIFDMDGVLLDSGAWHRAAWEALLTELGESPPQPDYWRLTIGGPRGGAIPLPLRPRPRRGARRPPFRGAPGPPPRPAGRGHLRLVVRRRSPAARHRAPAPLPRGGHGRRRHVRQAGPRGVHAGRP